MPLETNASEIETRLRLESLCAEPAFQELIAVAVDACFTAPERYDRALQEVRERRQSSEKNKQPPGSSPWVAREMIETVIGVHASLIGDEEQPVEAGEGAETKIRIMSDVSVQDRIEAFGKAIIEEAFFCLGDDAIDQVRAFKQAATPSEQYEVMDWLYGRLSRIRFANKEPDEADEEADDEADEQAGNRYDMYFHPLRLVPRFIGSYPNIELAPTCLGMSILAAAFVERAGIQYVHAGVAGTTTEAARESTGLAIDEIEKHYDQAGLDPGDSFRHYAELYRKFSLPHLHENIGYHAAAMARIGDYWITLDPNYNIYTYLYLPATHPAAEQLKLPTETLSSLDPSVRGVDCLIDTPSYSIMLGFEEIVHYALQHLRDLDEIKAWLQEAPRTTDIHDLVDEFVRPLFTNEDSPFANAYYPLPRDRTDAVENEHLLEELMRQSIDPEAFTEDTDGGLTATMDRCRADPHFLHRRAEDLQIAPVSAAFRLLTDQGSQLILNGSEYTMLEIGLPAFRIGACILSDFASLCDIKLPSSFWLANWASTVALTEHLPESDSSRESRLIATARAAYLATNYLSYYKSRGIITKYLEQGEYLK